MADRTLERERGDVDAMRRRSDEAYWSARLASRHNIGLGMPPSDELDLRSTEEILAGEADTIFAELQGGVGEVPLARELAEVDRTIALDNVRLRARFLDEVEVLPTPDAARHVGEESATLDGWRAERRVVAVPVGAAWLFPVFQFRGGLPKPVIARVLAELPAERSPWAIAFWFVSSNSWLGGPAPTSLMDDEPDAIVWAAAHERHEIGG